MVTFTCFPFSFAVADNHVGAVHDVNAVVVPVALGVYGDTLHQDAAALVVLLVPAGRIAQGDVLDGDAFAAEEMQVFRALAFLQAVQLEGILNEAQVAVIHALGGYQEAPAIDFAATGDADVFLANRKDQGGPFGIGRSGNSSWAAAAYSASRLILRNPWEWPMPMPATPAWQRL